MLLFGGITFGAIVGYLAWWAIRPGEPGTLVNLKTVGAFISVVGGAAVTTLFPAGSDLFSAYCIGLAIGFFFTPLRTPVSKSIQLYRTEEEKEFERNVQQIKGQWPGIEKIVRHKLENNLITGITVDDLAEFPVGRKGRLYIMRRFAQQHVDEGYELTGIDLPFYSTIRLQQGLYYRMKTGKLR